MSEMDKSGLLNPEQLTKLRKNKAILDMDLTTKSRDFKTAVEIG